MFTFLLFRALLLVCKLSHTNHFTIKAKPPLLLALLEHRFHTGSSQTETEAQILYFSPICLIFTLRTLRTYSGLLRRCRIFAPSLKSRPPCARYGVCDCVPSVNFWFPTPSLRPGVQRRSPPASRGQAGFRGDHLRGRPAALCLSAIYFRGGAHYHPHGQRSPRPCPSPRPLTGRSWACAGSWRPGGRGSCSGWRRSTAAWRPAGPQGLGWAEPGRAGPGAALPPHSAPSGGWRRHRGCDLPRAARHVRPGSQWRSASCRNGVGLDCASAGRERAGTAAALRGGGAAGLALRWRRRRRAAAAGWGLGESGRLLTVGGVKVNAEGSGEGGRAGKLKGSAGS